jgi:hypothetical protein
MSVHNSTPSLGAPGPRAWWRGLSARTRSLTVRALIAAGVILVLVSVGLARFLSVENTERDDLLALLQAQGKGDASAMMRRLSGCAARPGCAATVRTNAASLKRPGAVKILSIKSSTAYSLTAATGVTRVAWTVIGKLPVVQCVNVARTGNAISGIHVKLLTLSTPIGGEADC